MDNENTYPSFIFKNFGASYKGGRSYIHGSDIIEEIENFFSDRDGYILDISFIRELKSPGRFVFTENDGKNSSAGCAFGSVFLDGSRRYFQVENSDRALQQGRPYNEDAISVTSKNNIDFQVVIGHRSTMEHILRGTKFASMQISPIISRWRFAEMTNKTMPVPNIKTISSIEISLQRAIAGRMLAFSVRLDRKKLATIKFIGK